MTHLPPVSAARSLRSCAAGGGHHLAYVSKSFGGNYYCPRHLADLLRGFDPQPGDRVRTIDPLGVGPMADYEALSAVPGGRYEQEYVVRARDGDVLTLGYFGWPDHPVVQVGVRNLYPGSGSHITWRRGCGSN